MLLIFCDANSHQACTGVKGAPTGATAVTGDQYLHSLAYSSSHVWRNFGILWAWWAFFTVLDIWFTCRWDQQTGNSGVLLTPRGAQKDQACRPSDEESQMDIHPALRPSQDIDLSKRSTKGSQSTGASRYTKESRSSSGNMPQQNLARNTSIFTWRDLTYSIKTGHGERVLLDQVHGWVKPGMLGALMGSSGAGKTTLLDVLAQRKTEGTIKGSVLVDGRPLPVSFQRSAGYCEQMDVHEPLTTVREVRFSDIAAEPQVLTSSVRLYSSVQSCANHATCRDSKRPHMLILSSIFWNFATLSTVLLAHQQLDCR